MRVLIASHVLSHRSAGGVAARAVAVTRALAREGAEVRLLGTDLHMEGPGHDGFDGLDVVLIGRGLERFPLPLIGPRRLARLVDWADVAVLFSHWTSLNAAVYAACRRRGIPHIACPSGALPPRGRSQALKRAYEAVVGRRIVGRAAAVVATTALERQELVAIGAPPDRVVVIPNAVDALAADAPDAEAEAASAAFRRAFGLGASPFVLFMGRLEAIKGPDLLVEAFARIAPRFPDTLLVVAGRDGGLQPVLVELAGRSGIAGRVRFIGRLEHDRTPAAYRAAALLAVPSRSEAMSLVALEAGAAGTPVLLTEACGFDVGGFGGGLTVPATVDDIIGGLGRLLADPRELRAMGARLRAHVSARYVWPIVGRQWFELCGAAAGACPPG